MTKKLTRVLYTKVYKPTTFFYYVERFYNTLPAASMKAVGGNWSLTGERRLKGSWAFEP